MIHWIDPGSRVAFCLLSQVLDNRLGSYTLVTFAGHCSCGGTLMAESLPGYLKASVPNPASARAPWYRNTAPSYFGIFLWFPFYLTLAQQTLPKASLATCLLGLVAAGLLCFGLYYYAPAMLGMQTGRTLYIVGTSTFGTQGGYVMPGLLMGVLQVGWFAVATYFATDYILRGLHSNSKVLFIIVAVIWAYLLAGVAIKG